MLQSLKSSSRCHDECSPGIVALLYSTEWQRQASHVTWPADFSLFSHLLYLSLGDCAIIIPAADFASSCCSPRWIVISRRVSLHNCHSVSATRQEVIVDEDYTCLMMCLQTLQWTPISRTSVRPLLALCAWSKHVQWRHGFLRQHLAQQQQQHQYSLKKIPF